MLYDDDKRGFMRMMVNAQAKLEVSHNDKYLQLTATCRDLSATGMQLLVDEPIDPGATVKVDINSPDGSVPPLKALTQVVRCTQDDQGQYCIGVEMLDIN
ncbi:MULTISPECIES: PilZ domain-containing protein [Pseudoalteromonas]|uniref:PilZ domain-containing protein n=1 Tax=Pseudoalteromonas ruthenica TaxID=151081 RepID=A0A0F4Q069_9GAMM|nr:MULTISPECIES: PilZ domain-containing protein [Pseudoalteromonas]KJZ00709.1 hypothetical protein TW76_00370 [Pseudoalteromonas ruthenica]KJZ01237.1 hypothetical protein TW72_05240 [Pseudoalteromonas ruthenica]MCF2862979.1 PilZ domain-containing protein [Pseudoalteromonas sp. CNAT2-18]MCG7559131.1 PilZ domain-containing protein [Pseudoalteromonas sp. CNAT2-18.1]MCG7566766.1 PilZ domain-containing protein [Pseudoalteromonas sp. CnMc7-15]|tara:strand:+ start:56 stop:355 length:300 start_codon:yes stop_codon:yes gene_type:complete